MKENKIIVGIIILSTVSFFGCLGPSSIANKMGISKTPQVAPSGTPYYCKTDEIEEPDFVNGADSMPPRVRDFQLSSTSLQAGEYLSISVEYEESGSGLDTGCFEITPTSELGTHQNTKTFCSTPSAITATRFLLTGRIPKHFAPGNYTLSALRIVDAALNWRSLFASKFTNYYGSNSQKPNCSVELTSITKKTFDISE